MHFLTGMGTAHICLIRFNSVSESFDSNKLITHNGFTRLDLNKLTTQNDFLKVWFKSTHDSIFSESWIESTHDSMILFFPSFVSHFLGIQLYFWHGMTFFGLSTQGLTSYDLFWAFNSSAFTDKLSWISSWLKQHLRDLNRFNSWLKMLPDFSIQINPWL